MTRVSTPHGTARETGGLGAWEAALADLPASPPWLEARRLAALDHARRIGFPSTRDEDWQHTNVTSVARTAWRPAGPPSASERADAERLLESLPRLGSARRLVFVNGHLATWLEDGRETPAGVETASLAARLATDGAALEPRLGTLVGAEGQVFAALNTGLFTDGAFVRIGKNVDVDGPLHFVFLSIGDVVPRATHTRLVLDLEPGSRVSVVETWTGRTGGTWLSNTAVEAWLGANAHLDMLDIQRLPAQAHHFRQVEVRQARDSRFTSTCLSLGTRLARSEMTVRLAGEGAACRLDGLTLVSNTQHADHLTFVDHAVPHTSSQQLYKGVLDNQATTAFSGKVLVRPHAQKTDARQANHNLLLSADARADSKPQLEIFADDVKCAHGATVGQLDEDAIFYLRSRGLDAASARRLLLRAFAEEVPGRIEDEGLKAHAAELIEERLPRAIG